LNVYFVLFGNILYYRRRYYY